MGDYPECGMCKDGELVPFFLENGKNAYACTQCRTVFYLKVPQGGEGDPESWKAEYTIQEDFNL
jgi:hypothetical protein